MSAPKQTPTRKARAQWIIRSLLSLGVTAMVVGCGQMWGGVSQLNSILPYLPTWSILSPVPLPEGIFIDNAGNTYVAANLLNSIQKYDVNGNLLMQLGGTGVAAGLFRGPNGLTVDGWGYLYATDWTNNRIQKFDSNGVFVS